MRGGHLRCTLVGGGGASIRAIAWRSADTAIGQRLLAGGGSLHAVGKLKADDWNGRNTVELEIEDLADPRMN
jgi:single-stranded-DNA-specific exonuclease